MRTAHRVGISMAALVLLVCVGWSTAAGRADDVAKAMASAEALLAAGQSVQAAAAFELIVKEHPEHGVARVRWARALITAGNYERASEVARDAAKIDAVRGRALYNLGAALAGSGKIGPAFEALGSAIDAGFTALGVLQADPALEAVRGDARFEDLVRRIERATDRPEFHALDFWVGNWDVYSADGQQIGTNKISSLERGAIIFEEWSSRDGRQTGKSMNYYEPASGTWKQCWVAAGGWVVEMAGSFRDGAMRFEGTSASRQGPAQKHRTTFTPLSPTRVRQTIEASSDGGATFVVSFDAIYVPSGQAFTPEDRATLARAHQPLQK